MTPVIRRLGVLLVLLLTIGACAGSERESLAAGDYSISRGDLTELVVALNPGGPTELPSTLSAETFRGIADVWIRDAALATVLEENGVTMTEDERIAINGTIEDAVRGEQIGVLAPLSQGYAALQRNVWVAGKVDQLDGEAQARVQALMVDADIESRIGKVDPETTFIVAR